MNVMLTTRELSAIKTLRNSRYSDEDIYKFLNEMRCLYLKHGCPASNELDGSEVSKKQTRLLLKKTLSEINHLLLDSDKHIKAMLLTSKMECYKLSTESVENNMSYVSSLKKARKELK